MILNLFSGHLVYKKEDHL